MITRPLLLLFFCSLVLSANAQQYKQMMYDHNVNFYSVITEAESYFSINGKGKGSGWKGFQRWAENNEYKFYPTGDRINVDPFLVKNAHKANSQFKTLYPNGWSELGPVSPGQITGHYAFGMGRVVCFYVDPSNVQTLYLGSRTGGFWKSMDGGMSWSGGSTDTLAASGVNTIAVSPTNSDSILININNSSNHYTHGIYRSINGGNSWSLSNFNPTNLGWGGLGSNREIYKIKYHPTIPDLIFIGTRDGLYKSTDNLSTWSVPVSGDDFTDIDFHPTNPSIVYAYAKNNPNVVYVSTDTGATFTQTPIPGSAGGVGTIQVSASCPGCVYYMSNNGLWKSTNNGASFVLISNPGESDAGFAVSDLNDSNILAGYVDAFFSTDGGANFSQVTYWSLGNTNGAGSGHQISYNTSTDYIHADLQAAECLNGIFYAVTDGFMVKSSDNGANWEILSEDIAIRMNYNLGVSQSNHDRTIAGSQDNGTSINTENGWVEMYGADGMEGLIHPLNDDWMIGSWQNGGRRRTKDAGQSGSNVTPPGQTGYWVAPMFYDPNNQMTIFSLGDSVHRSDDFGDNWTNVGSPSFTGTIKYASIAENNSDIIVASRNSAIELSLDGGSTWSDIQGSLPSYSITDVAFDPNDDNTIIVTYARYQVDNSKVFITHDLGVTWTNITANLGNMPVRSVVIDHTAASTIYLGTEIGVYKKAMADASWSLYNPNLPNMSVREMEIMWGSNTVRATTWGRGLWEYGIDGRINFPTIVKTDISNLPTLDIPKEGVDQYITSTITHDTIVTSAYVGWSINAPIFDNVIAMSNTSGDVWISDAHLPNYPTGTKMYFKVFAVGVNGDTTETYKFMYTVHDFAICDAIGTNDGSNLRLTNVNISNIDNATGNDSYTYYGNLPVYLTAGATYSITLDGSTSWTQNDYAAWIDFNKDAVFDTNEEIIYVIDAGANTATANFTVPFDAVQNDTLRMRARIGYWYSVSIDPCGSALGEVEDYPVWITCDTSSNSIAVSACNSYNWNGVDYSSTGTYSWLGVNAAGCDSLVTMDLIIDTLDVSTSVLGSTIYANTSGLSYQWVDCENAYAPIIGETGDSLNFTSNGEYAVVILNVSCADTSECFVVDWLGLDTDGLNSISIYPNPNTGNFTISVGDYLALSKIVLEDSRGRIVFEIKSNNQSLIEVDEALVPGVYFLSLSNGENSVFRRVVIE